MLFFRSIYLIGRHRGKVSLKMTEFIVSFTSTKHILCCLKCFSDQFEYLQFSFFLRNLWYFILESIYTQFFFFFISSLVVRKIFAYFYNDQMCFINGIFYLWFLLLLPHTTLFMPMTMNCLNITKCFNHYLSSFSVQKKLFTCSVKTIIDINFPHPHVFFIDWCRIAWRTSFIYWL